MRIAINAIVEKNVFADRNDRSNVAVVAGFARVHGTPSQRLYGTPAMGWSGSKSGSRVGIPSALPRAQAAAKRLRLAVHALRGMRCLERPTAVAATAKAFTSALA